MGPAARRRERGFGVTRLSTETEVEGDDDIANGEATDFLGQSQEAETNN